MSSVTHRIREVKQPHGGYVSPKEFLVKTREDGIELKQNENIHASIIGMAVDYLTRFKMGAPLEEAFAISMLGASMIHDTSNAKKAMQGIKGLDDRSVANACQLVGYDVCVRAGIERYQPVKNIEPDADTLFNIRTMVNRSVEFWKEYGPVVKAGFTFEGGYTDIVSSGDGDYITKDTLWDFKVSTDAPKITHTLQLLVYYIMGCHSTNREFNNIQYLGIFNPRLNNVYLLAISQVSPSVIEEVADAVIGYNDCKGIIKNDKTLEINSAEKIRSDDWSLNDLVSRYGVSRSKITGDFFRLGLPHSMVGRSYRFSQKKVIGWEIDQKYVSYGKNQRIPLPAYIEYRKFLKLELKKAKKAGDKVRERALKQEAKGRNISISNDRVMIVLAFAFFVLAIIIMLKAIELI